MRRLLFCILTLSCQTILAQVKNDSIVTVSTSLTISFAKLREEKLNAYADSINNYNGDLLPNFLFNECLDWNASLWEGLHSAVSVRWKILSKVYNKQALKALLHSGDKRLKRQCSHISDNVYPYLSVPMIRKSFFQLIKERYEQL